MYELIKFISISFLCWLFFKAIKQEFFKDIVVYVTVIILLGSVYLWTTDLAKKANEKTEQFNKRIDGLKQSVDNFNESVDKVGKPVKDAGKTIKSAEDKIMDIDQRIENGYKNFTNKIFNKDKKE